MQILCGTDFSPNATEAATAAGALARMFGDRLMLVHAGVPPVDDGLAPAAATATPPAQRARLEAQVSALAGVGVPVEARWASGSPADALRRLASPDRTRMIVLSSIGQVALARAVLGSTADRVAESAPIATLVIRSARPFTEWARKKRALRVLIATDRSAAGDSALSFVRQWIQAGPVSLLLGHVEDPADPDSAQDLTERAGALLGMAKLRMQVVPNQDTAGAALLALAKEHRADLLVTGSHQRRGLQRLWRRSVSRALLADAPMSVAVVPVPPGGAPQPVPKMQRVLVTTDLSPAGNRALPAACALLPSGGVLRILHVLPAAASGFSLLGGSPHVPAISPGERKIRQRNVTAQLRRLVPMEAAARGIVTDPVVVEADDVAGAIAAEAARFGAHAVCMGSHGRGAAARLLMGSVTQAVLRSCPVPVHLVPPARD